MENVNEQKVDFLKDIDGMIFRGLQPTKVILASDIQAIPCCGVAEVIILKDYVIVLSLA